MIGVSVSDILKLLDQVPIWKSLVALPRRITALEERVAALEGASVKPIPDALRCPICGGTMRVTAEEDHPTFGVMGWKVHQVECSGGHKGTRDFDPSKGYR